MTIFKNFFQSKSSFFPVIGFRKNGRINHLNKEEYREEIERHISILKKLGIGEGDRVAIIAETSLAWHLFDISTMLSRAITVPIYTSFSSNDLKGIVKISSPSLFILESCKLYKKYKDCFDTNTKVICLDENSQLSDKEAYLYDDLLSNIRDEDEVSLEKYIKSLKPELPCSYLVTSGTTGDPKIAEFTLSAFQSLFENIEVAIKGRLSQGSRSITSLPLAHVLGRCDSYLHFALPVQTVFGGGLDTFISDLALVKPSYMVTVPRVITKMRERIVKSIQKEGFLAEALFQQGIETSKEYYEEIRKGKFPSNLLTKKFQIFQKTILKSVRDKVSPNIEFFVAGGAPLSEEDFNFFRSIGIPILEGYGLTETLGPICLNSLEDPMVGCVGIPFKDVKILIGEDGEILINSPFMLKRYINSPGNDGIDGNGYFHSGDIGEITNSGRLKITDRKKDIIVNSYGKNIYPLKIESYLSGSQRIEHSLVIGDGKPYLTALIFTSKDKFGDLIDSGLIDASISSELLTRDPNVLNIIEEELNVLNRGLAKHERVQKFTLIPLKLEATDSFITPSLKLKRDHIYNKFHNEIERMYT